MAIEEGDDVILSIPPSNVVVYNRGRRKVAVYEG